MTFVWLAVMCSIYFGEARLRSLKLLCGLEKKFPLQTSDFGLEMARAGTWGFPLLQKVLKLCFLELRYLERNQNPKFSTGIPTVAQVQHERFTRREGIKVKRGTEESLRS